MARVLTTAKKPVAKTAKSNPVIAANILASSDVDIAKEKTVVFDNGTRVELGDDIEIEGNVYGLSDKAAKMAFDNEVVSVIINESQEKNAERYVFLAINGVGAGPKGIPWVPRGQVIDIKRMYLNVLAGARTVRYSNYEYTTNDGERKSAQRPQTIQAYPFQVVHDANPKGREWLTQLLTTRRAG